MLEALAVEVARGGRVLLRDVTLAAGPGEAVVVRGANGSGKTSLLRVLAGAARPRRGLVRRGGPAAFVPERLAVAPGVRAGEWLALLRTLRGAPPVRPDAVAAAGLDPAVLGRPSRDLSKGTLRRLALVEALGPGAAVVVLDEPYDGLDAEARRWLRAQLAACPAAVVVSDHTGTAAGRVLEVRDGRLAERAARMGARRAGSSRPAASRAGWLGARR